MGILKKYLYAAILLGTIVLAGCSANEKTEEQVQIKEYVTNENAVKVMNLPDVDKEFMSVTSLDLTQEQKEYYHKQYVEIVKNINNANEDTNHLEVEPIEEFNSEDWVEPEKFRELAIDRSTWVFTSKAFGGDVVN